MATAKSFEDLFVWQKSRELVNLVYRCTRKSGFTRDHGLADQIRRAAVSVMSNIAEGFERGSKEEVLYFLYIAKASCGEVRAQLYVAYDQGYISETEQRQGIELAKYTSSLIANFINSLKASSYKGLKFKKPAKRIDTEMTDLLRAHLPADHPLIKSMNERSQA